MPEKELSKQILCFILAMSFVGALANALSEEELTKRNFLHFLIQVIVGGLSGIIFGFLGCWLVGENIYAVGCVSGIGAVLVLS